MNDLVLASSLLVLAASCSDEADIGVDSQPVQCAPDNARVADVAGSVTDPYNTARSFDFDSAVPTVSLNNGGLTTLVLDTPRQTDNGYLSLRFSFRCAPTPEVARYGVVADDQNQITCPFEVASAVGGSVEYLPATEGVMIVDQVSDCFAGRFRADFGDFGAIGGSFSTPWQ